MELDEARAFLRTHHRAVLATVRADGSPQLSPVAVGVDPQGRAVVSTREPAFKVRNARREPRVSLCVFTDAFYGPWVQVSGRTEVLSLPDALEPLVEYYREVSGEHPDWAEYRASMIRDRRCLLRITLEQAGPDRQG